MVHMTWKGQPERKFLRLDEMYADSLHTDEFIKFVSSRDGRGAVLPPELLLNESLPTERINYGNQVQDFWYGDGDADDEVIVCDALGNDLDESGE